MSRNSPQAPVARFWPLRYYRGEMAYFPDLHTSGAIVRIGWLARNEPFNQGAVDPAFLEKLKRYYAERVSQTRGFHMCPFCRQRRFGLPVEIDGKTLTLGSAEIEVTAGFGRNYRAPDMLYHYIVEHQYLPPQEFVDAVCG
jgi:hypothetical protein